MGRKKASGGKKKHGLYDSSADSNQPNSYTFTLLTSSQFFLLHLLQLNNKQRIKIDLFMEN